MTSLDSFLLLIGFVSLFGMLSYLISWLYTRHLDMNKSQFLVANRNLGFWASAFSIAATWTAVPSLFVSATTAFKFGWLGLFWFVAPNVLCLIIFAYFAEKVRNRYPQGFTLSGVIAENYSPRAQNLYWFALISVAMCSFATQLLAGGTLMSQFLNLPYWACTLIMALLPLSYSLVFGLRASIITDLVKMLIILTLGACLIAFIVFSKGANVALAGLAHSSPIISDGHLNLFMTFGLPVSIALLSGPFGDQSFWQRAFATDSKTVYKSFTAAAFIFAMVPLLMGTLGFVGFGSGMTVKNPGLVNLEVVTEACGTIGAIIFILVVMSAITAVLDSKLCAASSLAGHDIAQRCHQQTHNRFSSWGMIGLTICALIVANIPGMKVLHLFLFYGTLRAATTLPTVFMILKKPLSERGLFYGVLGSIVIGLPLFAYGNIVNNPPLIVAGSLFTLLSPVIINRLINMVSKDEPALASTEC